jgi:hypothetical protein
MAASIERIKNSQRLKDFIKEFKLEDCGCSNNREKLHLDTETWKLVRCPRLRAVPVWCACSRQPSAASGTGINGKRGLNDDAVDGWG